MGEWFTDEVRDAWEKWDAARKAKDVETMEMLVELVDGDPDQARLALDRFDVKMKGGAA
jgi:hypothetical protein